MPPFSFVLVFLSFLLVSSPVLAKSEEAPQISGLYQFSIENISLPNNEELGLLGGNYLVEKNHWYTGLGVYGAVAGDRGGFFTGGAHFGKGIPMPRRFFLDANVFVGGGGGGSAPQGGGLMLRAAAGVGHKYLNNRYFIGLSRVSFPNGDINSNQVSFA